MNSKYLKAPAKINIGLRILSKRKDGFHNIETIFYPVKLYDIILIKIKRSAGKTNEINLLTLDKNLGNPEENLCYKAANMFFSNFAKNKFYSISIKLRKNIPIGAGLGGGSSDAASVLKFLSGYFKLNSKQKAKLKKLALKLGSDVPFFLETKPAYASSRGELLKFLPDFKVTKEILIVYPNIHVSTAEAYKKLNIKTTKSKKFHKIIKFNPEKTEIFVNDFEKIVFKKYPQIEEIKNEMYKKGAIYSSLSGSGSCVYGIFQTFRLLKARKFFHSKGYSTFLAKK